MWKAFNVVMRIVSSLIGVVMILMGVVWILQGLNLTFRPSEEVSLAVPTG
jgi:hypothetical protein